MKPEALMLEELYKQARNEAIVPGARPVMELPPSQVSSDDKGRVFVDLRAVIDQLQIFISKGN